MVRLKSFPSSQVDAGTATVLALTILSSVPLPEPETFPNAVPLNVMPEKDWLKLYENVLFPSASWAMLVVPLARVFVELLPIPTADVPLYFVPLIVTDHGFKVDESMRPDEVATSFNVHATVLLLVAVDCPVTDQLNTSVSQLVTATDFEPLVAISFHLLSRTSKTRQNGE